MSNRVMKEKGSDVKYIKKVSPAKSQQTQTQGAAAKNAAPRAKGPIGLCLPTQIEE